MTRDEVLRHYRETGALLEGHFLLSSGLHSPVYMQSARVLMYPDRAEALARALADKLCAALGSGMIDCVVSPAMGGLIIGQEMARALKVRAMFTERVDGVFTLRRGFALEPGERVLVVEDVVTTGKSTAECMATIRQFGGVPVAASCLVDRSDGGVTLDVPLIALCGFKVPAYAADALPPELARLPAVKPGSRNLA